MQQTNWDLEEKNQLMALLTWFGPPTIKSKPGNKLVI